MDKKIENRKKTTMKSLAIICIVVTGLACYGLTRCMIRPVDGPGMERDSANYALPPDTCKASGGCKQSGGCEADASSKRAGGCGASGGQQDANSLYKVRMKNGEVILDFDDQLCKEFVEGRLDNPYNDLGKNRKVEGLEGQCVEVMKCIVGKGGFQYDGIGDPYLVMRTEARKVYVLSIIEALTEGDMRCGPVHGVTGALSLSTGGDKTNGEYAVARLAGGQTKTFGGWRRWGYYVIDEYNFVIHLTRDFCVSLDKEPRQGYHESGTFYESWAGSGLLELSTTLKHGPKCITLNIEDDAVKLDDMEAGGSLPVPCGQTLKVKRLYANPWDWGYFHHKK